MPDIAVTVAYALNFVWRDGSYTGGHAVTGPIVLSAVSLLVLGASGWLGGRLTYRYGVRVVDQAMQDDGFRARTAGGAVANHPQPIA